VGSGQWAEKRKRPVTEPVEVSEERGRRSKEVGSGQWTEKRKGNRERQRRSG
jgi:hypothetical protein